MTLATALRNAAVGARVSCDVPDRMAYSRDLWPRGLVELQAGNARAEGPAAIVWPETLEHVVALVRFARAEGIGLVPFGAGSGVCGAVLPDARNVVVDLKRIKSFRIEHGPSLDVGAGALGITLEESLLRAGHTIGHYPSSILCSTVGGWVAARGAGQCSGRYGKIEDMVTSLEVVLGSGEVLRARRRARGPDLIPLLVGSEGTLGIVTRVGLRLHAAPSARGFAAYSFARIEDGIASLRALYQAGLRPAVARLYDPLDSLLLAKDDQPHTPPAHPPGKPGLGALGLHAVLRAPALAARAMLAAEKSLASRVTLVLVFEGDATFAASEAQAARAICVAHGGNALGEGPARAWFHHRYHVSYRQAPLFRGGAFSDTMEVSARWSNIQRIYDDVRRALGAHALVMAHLSHSYPDGGSIYFTFAGSARSGASALEVYDRAWRAALGAALAAGASLSHHHGVGRSKAPRLGEELGAGVAVVRALKSAWDPSSILNLGALIPEPSASESRELGPAPSFPELDAESALCEFPAHMTLGDGEAWLAEHGRTLALDSAALTHNSELSLDAWLAAGMPGTRDHFLDPVWQHLAGFRARLRDGRHIARNAAPRRAVGPDLAALFVGTRGAFGVLESVTLSAPQRGTPPAKPLAFDAERDPALDPSEVAALDALEARLKI